jgi:hypothetical protein
VEYFLGGQTSGFARLVNVSQGHVITLRYATVSGLVMSHTLSKALPVSVSALLAGFLFYNSPRDSLHRTWIKFFHDEWTKEDGGERL